MMQTRPGRSWLAAVAALATLTAGASARAGITGGLPGIIAGSALAGGFLAALIAGALFLLRTGGVPLTLLHGRF